MVGYRPPPRGYYFVRQLLIVGALAGGLVALYRNDAFRDLSRRVGQEHRYLSLEQFLFGTPGWGTPRSMEPVLGNALPASPPPPPAEPALAAAPVAAAPAPARPEPVQATETAKPATAAPAEPGGLEPVPVSALSPSTDPLKPVSLDSLPLDGAGSRSVSLDNPEPSSDSASEPSRPAAPARAMKVSLDEPKAAKPVAKPAAPAKPPEPERPKVTQARPTDNPLTAAIRGAVRARPPKDTIPE
jgi:hypothetical protein